MTALAFLAFLLPLAPILAMLAARRTAKRDHEKMMTAMRAGR